MIWQGIITKYICRYHDTINKITRPLREHFGVGYFTYHSIDKNGCYIVLVDQPKWAEHYVSEKIYLMDPYLRKYDNFEPGICFFENHGSEDYKDKVLADGKDVLSQDAFMSLIEKDEEKVEFFGCSGKENNPGLTSL